MSIQLINLLKQRREKSIQLVNLLKQRREKSIQLVNLLKQRREKSIQPLETKTREVATPKTNNKKPLLRIRELQNPPETADYHDHRPREDREVVYIVKISLQVSLSLGRENVCLSWTPSCKFIASDVLFIVQNTSAPSYNLEMAEKGPSTPEPRARSAAPSLVVLSYSQRHIVNIRWQRQVQVACYQVYYNTARHESRC